MVQQQAAAEVGVEPGDVADVVAVLLDPLDHRVLVAEERSGQTAAGGVVRAVEADLVRALVLLRLLVVAVDGADVEAVAAVVVVGGEGQVRAISYFGYRDLATCGAWLTPYGSP